MAAAGFEDTTAEMSVVILAKGQEVDKEDEETQPQIYPLVTDDDVSEKQLRRCVYSHRCNRPRSWYPMGTFGPMFVADHLGVFGSHVRGTHTYTPSQVRDRLPGGHD